MNRYQLEHAIRAAGAICDVDELIIIGSQAILGSISNPPGELIDSMEVDIYPKDRPELSINIAGAIGERSLFHQTFGYYVDGVGPETAVLPDGWEKRLVKVCNKNTSGVIGWCLDPVDLAVSKVVAGRDKDLSFAEALIKHRIVDIKTLGERLNRTSLTKELRIEVESRLSRFERNPEIN